MKVIILTTILATALIHAPSKAADAYWLDQHNALLYLGSFQLDKELKEMSQQGTKTLLLHADALPSMISRFIAWRAKKVAGMDSIAWIQRPNRDNLRKAAKLVGFKGVQIDDHYFNKPPISIKELRDMLGQKELWCSFQPRQFTSATAKSCDQNDVQLYRYTCKGTEDLAWKLGITGNQRIAVAAYHDGSQEGDELIRCIKNKLRKVDSKLFVFKWKNQEFWIMQLLHKLQTTMKL